MTVRAEVFFIISLSLSSFLFTAIFDSVYGLHAAYAYLIGAVAWFFIGLIVGKEEVND